MPIRELVRRQPRCVTIAHISDLHFTPDTPLPPDLGSAHLQALVENVRAQQPDIIVVTGDVAENPWRDQLRDLGVLGLHDPAVSPETWSDSLAQTFARVRTFLEAVCRRCSIDPAHSLFVIPGNHDYRIQGMYSGLWWRSRYRATATPSDAFGRTFAGWYNPEVVDVLCRPSTTGSDGVLVRIVSLDSNDSDAYLNFATGALHQTELDKLDRLATALPDELRQALQVRVCLVHHHPLPVVSAEALRDLPAAGVVAKARNLLTTLTGEQTNMFKNGGTFLLKCLDNRVDLVLHGHQHRSWFSSIQYPAKTPARLLVAGAASACLPMDNHRRYCTYVLDMAGNIHVSERSTADNPIRYDVSTSFSVYSPDELRRLRRQKLMEQLAGTEIRELKSAYGIFQADESVRSLRIDPDGNALMTRMFKNLVPRGRDTVETLPISAQSPHGFIGLAPPRIKVLNDPDGYYESVTWRGEPGAARGQVVFSPELHADHPLSLEVELLLCNAFEFVKEYRRATSEDGTDLESSVGLTRIVYPLVATEIVLFPPGLRPTQRPYVQVSKGARTDEPDEAETEHCRDVLNWIEQPPSLSLSVREPLPSFNYKLSWRLQSVDDYHAAHYSAAGLRAYDRLAQSAPPDAALTARLTALLQSTKDQLRSLLDDTTEMSLHVIVETATGAGDGRKVLRELHEFAAVEAKNGGGSALGTHRLRPGIGVAGQAFRSEQPVLFRSQRDSGSQFYALFGGERTHAVLYSVPLRALIGQDPKVPVYAVVSIGTFADRSPLQRLETSNPEEWPFITDVVSGQLNGEIQKQLP